MLLSTKNNAFAMRRKWDLEETEIQLIIKVRIKAREGWAKGRRRGCGKGEGGARWKEKEEWN